MQPSPSFAVRAVEAAPTELGTNLALQLSRPLATLVAGEDELGKLMLPAGAAVSSDEILSQRQRHCCNLAVDVGEACVAQVSR